jgi:hypothetical protein
VAVPLRPKVKTLVFSARYAIAEWIGVGLRYADRVTLLSQNYRGHVAEDGPESSMMLFDGRVERRTVTAIVPVRYTWTDITFFGEIGASVYGSSRQRYNLRFLIHEESITDPSVRDDLNENTDTKRLLQTGMNRQFMSAGVAYPIWQAAVRLSGAVERVDVPDVAADWYIRGRFAVGIPF